MWHVKEWVQEVTDNCIEETDDMEEGTPITDFVKHFLNVVFLVGSVTVVLFLCSQLTGFTFV